MLICTGIAVIGNSLHLVPGFKHRVLAEMEAAWKRNIGARVL